MRLELAPINLDEAKAFIRQHHRHNLPPLSWKFGVAVTTDGNLAGVAMAGRPMARMLDQEFAIEIIRTCTTGAQNANSKLYGAILRAAKALGYRVAYTYTLAEESGSSLRASGWIEDAKVEAAKTWSRPSRHRIQVSMFGEASRPSGPKIRWRYDLQP